MNREEFYDLLNQRRSIRKYKSDPVPKEILERILNGAMQAPSGKNRQNWRFVVVSGRKRDEYLVYSQRSWDKIKEVLKVRLKPSLYDFTERFFYTLGQAPVIIFCYSINDPDEKYLTSIGSVYMAAENVNLAAFVEGLGCCTMGAPLELKDEINQFLGVTEWPEFKEGRMELLCGITLGYADHHPPKAERQTVGRVTWME
jgi:nitroreductase